MTMRHVRGINTQLEWEPAASTPGSISFGPINLQITRQTLCTITAKGFCSHWSADLALFVSFPSHQVDANRIIEAPL